MVRALVRGVLAGFFRPGGVGCFGKVLEGVLCGCVEEVLEDPFGRVAALAEEMMD